jgi:hypothetical protein
VLGPSASSAAAARPPTVHHHERLAAGLYVLAYLSAVIDGTRQGTGLYLEADTGRVGLRRYVSEHPWIAVGALAGIIGTIVAFA